MVNSARTVSMGLAISPFLRFSLGTLLQFYPQLSVIDYDSFPGNLQRNMLDCLLGCHNATTRLGDVGLRGACSSKRHREYDRHMAIDCGSHILCR